MPVTLNDINIETVTNLRRLRRPRLNNIPLGFHALQLSPSAKSVIVQYEVQGVWSEGDADYDSKEREVTNISDAGLPVWLDATAWRKNAMIFGRLSDFEAREEEGSVNVTFYSFLFTAVFPWGYIFVADHGGQTFKIYDLAKLVQSETIDPTSRKCNWAKTASQFSFEIHIKNVGLGTTTVKLEMMVPDGIVVANVTATSDLGGVITKAQGTVGISGISSVPGTKNRITLTKSMVVGVEEKWTITVVYASTKTSYLDGSIDEIVG